MPVAGPKGPANALAIDLYNQPGHLRHGFVWVWPGDAALADAATIPPCAWADSPDWAYGGGLYHTGCDYRLMVDKLMDLSHETYVHASSIGQKEIDETPTTPRDRDLDLVLLGHGAQLQCPRQGADRVDPRGPGQDLQ